jgi:hypothetical protein
MLGFAAHCDSAAKSVIHAMQTSLPGVIGKIAT